jgi:hypothetical protein
MKHAIICGIVLAFAACAMPVGDAAVTSHYDEIRGATTTHALVMHRTGTPSLLVQILATHDGRERTEAAGGAAVSFETMGPGWRLLRSHDVSLLIDGEERREYRGEHDGDVRRGGLVVERVTTYIPADDLALIAQASEVRGRVGPMEFALDADARENVRAFLDRVTPPAPGH